MAQELASVINGGDGIKRITVRREHFCFITHLFTEQCFGHRRIDTDPALFGVDFVVANDPEVHLTAIFILQAYISAEKHLAGIGWQAVYDLQFVQTFRQVGDSGDNAVQLFLVIGVIGVFTAVALGGCFADLC